MKIKLDENIAASVAPRLASLGFDTDTVLAEGLRGRDDVDVWAAAQTEGRLLMLASVKLAHRDEGHAPDRSRGSSGREDRAALPFAATGGT